MKAFLQLLTSYMFLLVSCLPAYRTHMKEYERTASIKGAEPAYADLAYWAAHPWKKDPSDSIPKPLRKLPVDTSVDVFFIHPTTLTDKTLEGKVWNADIADPAINAKTDYTSILYQASIFNGSCRVFAPRYRQAHLYSFYSGNSEQSKAALELAYADVRKAFLYYLENHHQNRPIIIAAHSQGTYHAGRLLKEFFENKPLTQNLVCAYLIGLGIPYNYFSVLEPCTAADKTQCFVTWRTFREGYLPDYVLKEKGNTWTVNPLSWSLSDSAVPRQQNPGAVLLKFNKPYKHINGARNHKGVIWINRPKFLWGIFLRSKNYHAGDMNLFYYSIRENVQQRIATYKNQTTTRN